MLDDGILASSAFPVLSFRAKREIFPCTPVKRRVCDERLSGFLSSRMHAVHRCDKKDPSAALGMTKREDGLSHISSHPAAEANLRPFGAPPSKERREKSKILPAMGKAAKREYRCPEGADRAQAA